ncbi:MAG: Na+/H+ antiporter NhaC family protein [Bacteroidia bacterium]|nr:Na+/H+ antiporter NhaC family protein [Bacteroidia bacterium]
MRPGILRTGIIALFLLPLLLQALFSQGVQFETPDVVLDGVGFTTTISVTDAYGRVDTSANGELRFTGFTVDGAARALLRNGVFSTKTAEVRGSGQRILRAEFASAAGGSGTRSVRVIPGLLSILPPLLAIVLALLIRQVVVALVAGIWLGATFIYGYDPFTGFLHVLDVYIVGSLADTQHISIIAFSMLFGGMVGVMSKSGGTLGIANTLSRMAHSPRRGLLATWLLGFVIFFDDYANTLIVGNTMRPITDRLRISREKLAYLVDSTAAPVSSLLFVSTWIGYEVGLIDQAMQQAGMLGRNAYAVFLDMMPFSFYPIFTLAFALMLVLMGRDFGPMRKAELRARREGKLYRDGAQLATDLTDSSSVLPAEGVLPRWWNAVLPILTVLIVALVSLYITGNNAISSSGSTDYSLGNVIGQADSYRSLLWASLLACVVAIALAVGQRTLGILEAMEAWFNGLKSMLLAMLILTLAWSIGQITADLHTATYLVDVLRGTLDPRWLPVFTFLVAAAVSFATGTSWGTMGIMMPLVLPLAVVLGADGGLDASHAYTLVLGSIASVLAGAVFGDHCSPISDTTILSSMASACDHIDHVRTQLPYALLPALVSLLVGLLPAGFDIPPWYTLPLGFVVMAAAIRYLGSPTSATQ